jgi:hypothetical protein
MAKKKPKRTWVWSPRKSTPPAVPDDLKAEVEAEAGALIREFLVPSYVKPPPEDKHRHLDEVAQLVLLPRRPLRDARGTERPAGQ